MKLLKIFEKPSTQLLQKQQLEAGNKLEKILEQKVPTTALAYCMKLWYEHPFSFTLSRTRSTCFGNYTLKNGEHKITVNHDLNPSAFLITYIHEIAHQRTWLKSGRKKILPHGKEWKQNFQSLMQPVLNNNVFPEQVLPPLKDYLLDPAASSVSHAGLAAALQSLNPQVDTESIMLADVLENQSFIFQERVFIKLEKRRTRVLCMEQKSKRRFTILASARVKPLE